MRGAGEGKRFVVGSWQLLIIRGRGRGGRQTDGTQAPATNYQLPTTAVAQHACRAAAFHQRRLLCWRRGLLRWEHAPLAQLDRASGYEPEGREFESLRARHFLFEIRGCAPRLRQLNGVATVTDRKVSRCSKRNTWMPITRMRNYQPRWARSEKKRLATGSPEAAKWEG